MHIINSINDNYKVNKTPSRSLSVILHIPATCLGFVYITWLGWCYVIGSLFGNVDNTMIRKEKWSDISFGVGQLKCTNTSCTVGNSSIQAILTWRLFWGKYHGKQYSVVISGTAISWWRQYLVMCQPLLSTHGRFLFDHRHRVIIS